MTVLTETEILANGQLLAAEILASRQTRLEAEAKKPPFKARRHYASALTGCARALVYGQTHWDQKKPFTTKSVAAMQDGQHEERLLIQELLADGFEVVEQQVQLDDDRYFVTGRVDGKIKWAGRRVPFECKRLQPFAYDRLQSVRDFYEDAFALKNLRQLTLYLLLNAEPLGLMILSNGLGARNIIPVPLDYALGESILRDLETANAHLKAQTLPDRIGYGKTCQFCPFTDICLPQVNFGEGAHMAEPELEEKLRRLQELKPLTAELEHLKKEIKTVVEGKEITVAGSYVVTGKWQERTVKAQEARTDRFWTFTVENLKTPND